MIDVTITTGDDAPVEYPKIMEGRDGLLVLFDVIEQGTVIKANKAWALGKRVTHWDMATFKPFLGSVTLTQS